MILSELGRATTASSHMLLLGMIALHAAAAAVAATHAHLPDSCDCCFKQAAAGHRHYESPRDMCMIVLITRYATA